MLSLFKKPLFNRGQPADSAGSHAQRLAIYEQELGEREYTFSDSSDRRIDVHAFGRDFVPDCEEGSDEGYVLLTNGMSEHRMAVPDQAEAKLRAELMWYVREATPEVCTTLRWLASLPFIDTATTSPHRGHSPPSCTMSAPTSSPPMSRSIQVCGALAATSSSSTSLSSVLPGRRTLASCCQSGA